MINKIKNIFGGFPSLVLISFGCVLFFAIQFVSTLALQGTEEKYNGICNLIEQNKTLYIECGQHKIYSSEVNSLFAKARVRNLKVSCSVIEGKILNNIEIDCDMVDG